MKFIYFLFIFLTSCGVKGPPLPTSHSDLEEISAPYDFENLEKNNQKEKELIKTLILF